MNSDTLHTAESDGNTRLAPLVNEAALHGVLIKVRTWPCRCWQCTASLTAERSSQPARPMNSSCEQMTNRGSLEKRSVKRY